MVGGLPLLEIPHGQPLSSRLWRWTHFLVTLCQEKQNIVLCRLQQRCIIVTVWDANKNESKNRAKTFIFQKIFIVIFFKSKAKLISYTPNIVLLPAFQSKGILFSRVWNVSGFTAAELRHSFQSCPPLRSYWPGVIESLIIYFLAPLISRIYERLLTGSEL